MPAPKGKAQGKKHASPVQKALPSKKKAPVAQPDSDSDEESDVVPPKKASKSKSPALKAKSPVQKSKSPVQKAQSAKKK